MDDGYCHHNIYKMWEWHSSLCNSRVRYKMNKANITKYPHSLCLTLCNSGHSRKAGVVYMVLCVLVLDRAHHEMRSPRDSGGCVSLLLRHPSVPTGEAAWCHLAGQLESLDRRGSN